MTNRAVDQLQAGLNGAAADLLDLFVLTDAFDLAVRSKFR